MYCVASAALVCSLLGRASALCASLSCALCVLQCVLCLRTCLLSVLGVFFALLLVHSLRPLRRRHRRRARTTPAGPRHMETRVLPTPRIIVTTVPKTRTRPASPPRRRVASAAGTHALNTTTAGTAPARTLAPAPTASAATPATARPSSLGQSSLQSASRGHCTTR